MQYSYLPVVDVLPGRPGTRPRGRPGAVRRRLRPLVRAAARTTAPAWSSSARAWARSVGRPRSAASTTCATGPAGAVFAGPPNFNTLYREFVDDRDAGSREVTPEYRDGRTVRFTDDPARRRRPRRASPGTGSRVLYLLHPSDPIILWSPQLHLRPSGLARGGPGRRRRRRDAVDPVRHLLAGDGGPALRHQRAGRPRARLHDEYVDAWAHVLQPPGWTDEKADQLRDLSPAAADARLDCSRMAAAARPAAERVGREVEQHRREQAAAAQAQRGEEDARRGRAQTAQQHGAPVATGPRARSLAASPLSVGRTCQIPKRTAAPRRRPAAGTGAAGRRAARRGRRPPPTRRCPRDPHQRLVRQISPPSRPATRASTGAAGARARRARPRSRRPRATPGGHPTATRPAGAAGRGRAPPTSAPPTGPRRAPWPWRRR